MPSKRKAQRSLGKNATQAMTLEQFTALGYGDIDLL
jgi:hypothetical protein